MHHTKKQNRLLLEISRCLLLTEEKKLVFKHSLETFSDKACSEMQNIFVAAESDAVSTMLCIAIETVSRNGDQESICRLDAFFGNASKKLWIAEEAALSGVDLYQSEQNLQTSL